MPSVVHVVHCIDTEGPLHESLEATFERLNAIFGLDLPPSANTLRAIQNQQMDLNGLEKKAARVFAPDLLDYNDTWDKLDGMLERVMAPEFRESTPDSFGNGWVYNWFCVDHIGYRTNPRDRDLGLYRIHDHYCDMMAKTSSPQDGLYFHFHPVSLQQGGTHAATRYFNDGGRLYDILAHYILDKQWFPSAYRPGFHSERPDSHWFLEQFIPFDFANQATHEDQDSEQKDISGGRFGDWRRAPVTWQPYHPDPDDYQRPGACRRWIMRCLNVGTRLRLLEQNDVDQAFQEAADGLPVVLCFANHDFRNIDPDVTRVMDMLKAASDRFPDVPYRYADAREAVRGALGLKTNGSFELTADLDGNVLRVQATAGKTFGPQPFLAIRTRSGEYHHDNLDFTQPFSSWSYTFDEQTVSLQDVDRIGVAACDAVANVCVTTLNPGNGKSSVRTF